MAGSRPTARVYIDGFNLYYGALRKTPHRWLDVLEWSRLLLPHHEVEAVVYCTARVTALPHDPHAPTRQQFYLRALESLAPRVEVLEGHFRVRDVTSARVPNVSCTCCASRGCKCCAATTATIKKPEEKGSDVNLAVRLVRDHFVYAHEASLVVSDDSDLQEAVRILEGMGRRVIVANPRKGRAPSLVARERREVRPKTLARAQFPSTVTLPDGSTTSKPGTWQ
nr:NYN domain-containing protein [Isoptericola halotolerans]